MPHITTFDPVAHHIHLSLFVTDPHGKRQVLDAILDTGAPVSEFADQALQYIGLLKSEDQEKTIKIKKGLQTQKYGKIILPLIEICGYPVENFMVFVSRFEESWGVDALIGLDFFKRFRVTIDYSKGELTTEPLSY